MSSTSTRQPMQNFNTHLYRAEPVVENFSLEGDLGSIINPVNSQMDVFQITKRYNLLDPSLFQRQTQHENNKKKLAEQHKEK
uniref:Uncharacterized protein n=1 Tax=Rhizophora mucronata TaxID=61149 RepID=A0A2P2QU99_RHIMU